MSEWGPWLDHDGSGCPCVGQWVESIDAKGVRLQHIAHGWWSAGGPVPGAVDCWCWTDVPRGLWRHRIIRYRIRRPKALDLCRRIASLTDREVEHA